MTCQTKRVGLLLLALVSTLCSGCVEGQVLAFIRYEPADDSFRCMQVYTNINATEPKLIDHLESLWKRRHSIIINPVEFNIFHTIAYERFGKQQFSPVDLGDPPDKKPEIVVTQVDLDSIKVIPGEFYLNGHGNLSFYQQCVVPGKTLDAIIEEITPALAKEVSKLAEERIAQTKKENIRHLTWNDLRKELIEDIVEKFDPRPEAKKPEGGESSLPLELSSLQMLAKAGTDKSIKISRKRDVFTVLAPLSKRDCHEAITTVDRIREANAIRIKTGKRVEEGLQEALEALKLRYLEGIGLEISFNISKVVKVGKYELNPKPNESKKEGYKTTAASIQGRKIEINKSFSIEKLVAEYLGK